MSARVLRVVLALATNLLGIEMMVFDGTGPWHKVARMTISAGNGRPRPQWVVVCGWGIAAVVPTRAAAQWRCSELEAHRLYCEAVHADAQREIA